MRKFLILCLTMHTGIFASTTDERTAALKAKAAQRQTGIDALKKSTADAERELTATRAEEARLKQDLMGTIDATDASADTMRDQLQAALNVTIEQTEQHARQSVEKESYIEQFDTLRSRYEHLFKILMDKLKDLQLNALEDKETIERLTLERDMYIGELTDAIQIGLPKHATSSSSMGTQTGSTPKKQSSTGTKIANDYQRALTSNDNNPSPKPRQPTIENIKPPKVIRAAINRLNTNITPFADWQRENIEYTTAGAKGRSSSITPQNRHIYRCWVAAVVIQESTPTAKRTITMQKWMTGGHRETHIPELSNNSCFQKGTKYQELYSWMKDNDILFPAAEQQMSALSPSRTPQASSSPKRLRANNPTRPSPSPASSAQTVDRDLDADFQAAGTHASPSPARPGLYADVAPVKPFSPIRELSPEEQHALSPEQRRLYNYHKSKADSPKTNAFADPQERFNKH